MEKQYSVKFFSTFVNNLQKLCRTFLEFNQVVEVSGYVCVEIDNSKKERYVLSEMIQNGGNVVSESYCTKVFRTLPLATNSDNSESDLFITDIDEGCEINTPPNKTKSGKNWKESHITEEDRREEYSSQSAYVSPRVSSGNKAHSNKSISYVNQESEETVMFINQNNPEVSKETADIHSQESSFERWKSKGNHVETNLFEGYSVEINYDHMSRSSGQEHSSEQHNSPGQNVSHEQVVNNLISSAKRGHADIKEEEFMSCSGLQAQRGLIHGYPKPATVGRNHMPPEELYVSTPVQHSDSSVSGFSQRQLRLMFGGKRKSQIDPNDSVETSEIHPRKLGRSTSDQSVFHISDPTDSTSPQPHVVCSHGSGVLLNDDINRQRNRDSASQGLISTEKPSPGPFLPIQQRPSSESRSSDNIESPGVLCIDDDSDEVIEIDLDEIEREGLGDFGSPAGHISAPPNNSSFLYQGGPMPEGNTVVEKYEIYCLKRFEKFQRERGEVDHILQIPPNKLDVLLGQFFMTLKKANGEEFGANTLRSIHSHIDRYLKDNDYPSSITRDPIFINSRELLKNKINHLKLSNPGTLRQKILDLNNEDIELLFRCNQLGTKSADSILNTLWFMNSVFFGMKKGQDHYNLKWSDIVLSQDVKGQEFLDLAESRKVGKIRTQRLHRNFQQPDRCFVELYKKYCKARPLNSLHEDAPFYLSAVRNQTGIIFKSEKAGYSRLSSTFKRMMSAVQYYSNP